MSKPIRSLTELEMALRDRLNGDDTSLRTVARETGIPHSRLSDFRTGKRGLPMERLNTVANHYGVRFRLENWRSTDDEKD